MAYTITTPEFSFVRMSEPSGGVDWREKQIPGAELGVVLPVNHANDVAFQLLVTTDTAAEADDICGIPTEHGGLIIAPGASWPGVVTFANVTTILGQPDTIFENFASLQIGRYRLSDTEIVYFFPRIPDMVGYPCDQCFQIVFSLSVLSNTGPSAASNPFIYRCNDTDFTSVLDYYSERDEAGFLYCLGPDMKNKIRLPVYLTRPGYPDEETIQRDSKGVVRIQKSQVRKVYDFVTDSFPTWAVESLRAVFIHDFVFIEGNPAIPQVMPYEGQIVKEGTFEPVYLDYKNYPLATITLKVNAADYILQKNNCGLCGDYSSMITTTDITISVTQSQTYRVNLLALTDLGCCLPVQYAIYYYQSNYIASISIDQSFGVSGNKADLIITMKASFIGDEDHPPPLAKVSVLCGGVVKYINVFSNLP